MPAASFVDDIFDRLGGEGRQCDYYVCGSPGFQGAVTAALKAKGASNVYSEAFKGHNAEDA